MYGDSAGASRLMVTAFGGKVFGIDAQTGKMLWKHTVSAETTVELYVCEALILAACWKTLVCLENPSGILLWRAELRAAGRVSLLVQGDRIFAAASGEVSCFDRTGALVWTQQFKGEGPAPVAMGLPGNVRQADTTG